MWPVRARHPHQALGGEIGIAAVHFIAVIIADDQLSKGGPARNLRLLRQELERDPDDLTRLVQFIESGRKEPDVLFHLNRAVELRPSYFSGDLARRTEGSPAAPDPAPSRWRSCPGRRRGPVRSRKRPPDC